VGSQIRPRPAQRGSYCEISRRYFAWSARRRKLKGHKLSQAAYVKERFNEPGRSIGYRQEQALDKMIRSRREGRLKELHKIQQEG